MTKSERNNHIYNLSPKLTHAEIAKKFKISKKTVQRVLKDRRANSEMSTSKPKVTTKNDGSQCPLDKTCLSIEEFTHHKTILYEGCSINQLETAVYHLEGKLNDRKLNLAKTPTILEST